MFPNLKLQIFRRGSHQNHLARDLGIDATVLSKIIHGYRSPTEEQKRLLSAYLEADEEWLFEPFELRRSQLASGRSFDAEKGKPDYDGHS
jgi:transcriptional regulator with XRE-family HTH domain